MAPLGIPTSNVTPMFESEYHIDCIWDAKAMLGEGPVWHRREKALYWVDINASNLHRYIPETANKRTWHLPPSISSVVPCTSSGMLGTFADGIKLINTEDATTTVLLDPEPDLPGNRLNDGACDAQGNFWFGSMDNAENSPTGAFYRLTAELECQRIEGRIVITNGPAFSPDGETIYLTDTLERTIFQAQLSNDGSISHKEIFARINEDEGYPDGMTVDAEGYVWCAHFAGARITRFTPSGDVNRVIAMPVPNITKCCFGGDNLQTLFITTAAKGLTSDQREVFPQAGGLFAVHLDVKGVPAPYFAY